MISNIYNCEFISLGIIAKFVLTLYIFFLISSLKIIQLWNEEKQKAKEKRKYIPIWIQSSKE